MKLKIDSEFETLLPPLKKEEVDNLKKSLLVNGCHSPLIAWGDILIDGHNRYKIINSMVTPCHFDVTRMEFNSKEDALVWVIDNQNSRRNSSAIDLVKMKEKKHDILQRQAKERMSQGGGDKKSGKVNLPYPVEEKGQTRDKMAAEIGISGKTYDALAKVNKKGIPEIVAAVRNKHVGAATAAKIADLSESEQLELMSEGEQEIVKKFNEKQKPKKKGVEKKRNLGRKPDYEVAMKYARMAVAQLECIYHNHHDRDQAFDYVIKWINNNRTGRK